MNLINFNNLNTSLVQSKININNIIIYYINELFTSDIECKINYIIKNNSNFLIFINIINDIDNIYYNKYSSINNILFINEPINLSYLLCCKYLYLNYSFNYILFCSIHTFVNTFNLIFLLDIFKKNTPSNLGKNELFQNKILNESFIYQPINNGFLLSYNIVEYCNLIEFNKYSDCTYLNENQLFFKLIQNQSLFDCNFFYNQVTKYIPDLNEYLNVLNMFNNYKFNIKYGNERYFIDITDICIDKLIKNDVLFIDFENEFRNKYFKNIIEYSDKNIYIIINNTLYNAKNCNTVYIDIKTNSIYFNQPPNNIYFEPHINIELSKIHQNLKIDYGDFHEEKPEQIMALKFLTGFEKVLEIGGNIGRNSLIIAYILNQKNNNNFVVLESNSEIFKQLEHNKNLNTLDFHIFNYALSKKKLIQKGWDTIQSDILNPGYLNVNIIDYDNLIAKFNIDFDTLVIDCEGAFYYILLDMPEILNNIKLVIMENDYKDIKHKNYVDDLLIKNGLTSIYHKLGGCQPCYDKFFEVWKKI